VFNHNLTTTQYAADKVQHTRQHSKTPEDVDTTASFVCSTCPHTAWTLLLGRTTDLHSTGGLTQNI